MNIILKILLSECKLNNTQEEKVITLFFIKFYGDLGVYEEGEIAESFYIVKEGSLKVETTLTVEKMNMWPVV